MEIVGKARAVNKVLLDFKHATFGDIAAFIQLSAEQYRAVVGGKKGNVTLLSFDGGEAMTRTKTVDGRSLSDRGFLEEWIKTEARRRGGRGGGGESLFGGLFKSWKS